MYIYIHTHRSHFAGESLRTELTPNVYNGDTLSVL